MTVNQLLTPWGEKLQENLAEIPLNDYPRPQLVRENWQNLNGWWDYAITKSEVCPKNFSGKIRVPFSPETILSHVEKILQPDEFLWYKKEFILEKKENKQRTLLHFGAVDQECQVFLNGEKIGEHLGGYWPFTFDVTAFLQEKNELILKVKDLSDNEYYAYGKQKLKHGQIWYTPQSGIWQTVWLENVAENYVKNISYTPLFDTQQIKIQLDISGYFQKGRLEISFKGEKLIKEEFTQKEFQFTLPKFFPWSPKHPHLYEVKLSLEEDEVHSYFAMRKFSLKETATGKIPLLNNQPIFFNGLLDQGYFSDGLYTPPSDEAMIYDIQTMKNLGFNLLRKHIKIEPLRWYYHCDRLGMMVWQDFVSGGAPYHPLVIQILPFINITLKDSHYSWFGRKSAKSRQQYYLEAKETLELLKNIPSIAAWVPFNEGWGQFDSLEVEKFVRSFDETRLIDLTSGYHDEGGGDFHSPHIYFKKYRLKKDPLKRVQVLSEFGGYSLPVSGHMASDKLFGYKKYDSEESFMTAYLKLFEQEIFPAVKKGLAGTVYTQVSDVEDEINGLLTFDRKVVKVDEEKLKQLNQKLEQLFYDIHRQEER